MPFGDTTRRPFRDTTNVTINGGGLPNPSPEKELEKPAAIGCCKALGRKVGNQWIKPAYPELDEYNVNVQLKELLKNSFVEIVWGDMLLNDLRETPVSVTLKDEDSAHTYHLNLLPVELNDDFEFAQSFVAPDSMPINLKKQLSREILKQWLPQLWRKGYYTVLDIKPDNFHIEPGEDGSFIVQLFDWNFKSHLLENDIFSQLRSHLINIEMSTTEIDTFESVLNKIVINNNKTDITNRVYGELTDELTPQWQEFVDQTKDARDRLIALAPQQRKHFRRPTIDSTQFPHPMSYLSEGNPLFKLTVAVSIDDGAKNDDMSTFSSHFLMRLNSTENDDQENESDSGSQSVSSSKKEEFGNTRKSLFS